MVQLLGTGIEAEQTQVYEEARAVLGSVVTQMIGIVRQIYGYVMSLSIRLIAYAGEHPLAMTLIVANLCVWVA